MHKTERIHWEEEIAAQAITALGATARLTAQFAPANAGQPGDGLVTIKLDGKVATYSAEIREVDRVSQALTVKTLLAGAAHPMLLVAPHISAKIAEFCFKQQLQFIDCAGNAYLELEGNLIMIIGRPRRMQPGRQAFKSLTPAGIRVVFALLCQPVLAAATQREIASAAGVALGTVGPVLANLEARAYLFPAVSGKGRGLLDSARLAREWAALYPVRLRPKLRRLKLAAPDPAWWRTAQLPPGRAWWSGETAGELLTGYLKATHVTLYLEGDPGWLIREHRLRADEQGTVEVLSTFGAADLWSQPNVPPTVAPPLLVYADLRETADSRCQETAQLVWDGWLKHA